MNRLFPAVLSSVLAVALVWGILQAAEVTDLNTSDAANTGTAANAGFPENMPPSDVNNAARALSGMIARWYDDVSFAATSGGVANAITATAWRTISAYEQGLTMAITVAVANTSTTSLDVDGVGTREILKYHDQPLASGDLEAGQMIIVAYDAAQDAWQLLTPIANAPGDLLAANNLSDLNSAATGRTNLGVAYGNHTIWLPAGSLAASSVSGAASNTFASDATKPTVTVLDFDPASEEFAEFTVNFPKSWDESQVTAAFVWMSSNSTGVVEWGIRCVSISDDDTLNAEFGSGILVTDTATAVSDAMISGTTSGLDCSAAESDVVFFQVYRNAGGANDTSLVDGSLIGVRMLYRMNANNDD